MYHRMSLLLPEQNLTFGLFEWAHSKVLLHSSKTKCLTGSDCFRYSAEQEAEKILLARRRESELRVKEARDAPKSPEPTAEEVIDIVLFALCDTVMTLYLISCTVSMAQPWKKLVSSRTETNISWVIFLMFWKIGKRILCIDLGGNQDGIFYSFICIYAICDWESGSQVGSCVLSCVLATRIGHPKRGSLKFVSCIFGIREGRSCIFLVVYLPREFRQEERICVCAMQSHENCAND